MIHRDPISGVLITAACTLLLFVFAGCGAKKDMLKNEGLSLKYAMMEGGVLRYHLASGFTQSMEVNGQQISVSAEDAGLYSMQSRGTQEGNYRLAVMIDSMTSTFTGPQGKMPLDLSSVIGKDFTMIITPLGKEKDVSSAVPIEYTLGAGEKQSVLSTFKAFFPDLPRRPVRVGDEWTTVDTVSERSENGESVLILSSRNRLEGFETIGAIKCAKVTATVSGSISGKGTESGMELVSRMDVVGNDIWYFCPERGVFVKSVSEGTAQGEVVGTGTQQMTIPIKRDYNISVELIP